VARACTLGALAGAAALAAAGLSGRPEPAPGAVVAAPPAEDPLTGLWSRHDGESAGDPLRFWYFHGDGHGLYRYGRVGLNKTNSFDYVRERDTVQLHFRKTGERDAVTFSIETDAQGQDWLSMEPDPREPGARYRKARGRISAHEGAPESTEGPEGRLWIDHRNYATGGSGFALYQLAPAAIDGRGVGWYHEGDFDDWSTESLSYRIDQDHLDLRFEVRGEAATTHFVLEEEEGSRTLLLREDPRGFWAPRWFRDGGESFGDAHAWHRVAATGLVP
jgi:hypothetical protein